MSAAGVAATGDLIGQTPVQGRCFGLGFLVQVEERVTGG